MFNTIFDSLLGKRKNSEDDEEEYHDAKDTNDNNSDDNNEGWLNQEDDNNNLEVPNISSSTMAQYLTKALPDANIISPNVIIVGGQSAGKTKVIINLVFYYLLNNNKFDNNIIGNKLLKIFRTGNKMVTRRPTTIELQKDNSNNYNIIIETDNKSISYNDNSDIFDAMINKIHNESMVKDGKVYGEELKVIIKGPSLPNVSFTDLPGLITDDKVLSDNDNNDQKTIKNMIKSYMVRNNTTLVVVEPASIEDFETSQISPLLRDIQRSGKRTDIFDHSVLVLSKCDKIRQGLEQRIMKLIDLSSPQLYEFPYKHVVGVVNKIEDSDSYNSIDDAPVSSFQEFVENYKQTKQHELEIFSSYHNANNDKCDTSTQCTTAAVFHQMDRISFQLINKSLSDGTTIINDKIKKLENMIKLELAPPLGYYAPDNYCLYCDNNNEDINNTSVNNNYHNTKQNNNNRTNKSATSTATYEDNEDTNSTINKSINNNPSGADNIATALLKYRLLFIKEIQSNIEEVLAKLLKNMHPYTAYVNSTSNDQNNPSIAVSDVNTFIAIEMEDAIWPEFILGDMMISVQQQKCLTVLKKYYYNYIESILMKECIDAIINPVNGCFTNKLSPFHRIDRFPLLCAHISKFIKDNSVNIINTAKNKVNHFLQHQWEYEVPKGITRDRYFDMYNELYHISVRTIYHSTLKLMESNKLTETLYDDILHSIAFANYPNTSMTSARSGNIIINYNQSNSLFQEDLDFITKRNNMLMNYNMLIKQKELLLKCEGCNSNEDLRVLLEVAVNDNNNSNDNYQYNMSRKFWMDAEQLYDEERAARVAAATSAAISNNNIMRTPSVPIGSGRVPTTEQFKITPNNLSQSSNNSNQYACAPYGFRLPSINDYKDDNDSPVVPYSKKARLDNSPFRAVSEAATNITNNISSTVGNILSTIKTQNSSFIPDNYSNTAPTMSSGTSSANNNNATADCTTITATSNHNTTNSCVNNNNNNNGENKSKNVILIDLVEETSEEQKNI